MAVGTYSISTVQKTHICIDNRGYVVACFCNQDGAPEGHISTMTLFQISFLIISIFFEVHTLFSNTTLYFPAKVSSEAWRTSSSRSTLLLHSSVGVASSSVAVEKLLRPPSAQQAHNHHSVCSCWTKWTEEYLKAYHWHCITQNSFCLCYAHLSRSWSTFGMAGWSFCQGRIGRDCVQAFSMFSLQVLWMFLWSTEAAKQQSRER